MMKNLWSEFKAFAFKGNMLDLAVAVVIGAAFSSVIGSLVKDIIMPSISYVASGVSSASRAVGEVAHVTTPSHPETQPSATQPAAVPPPAPPAPAPAPAPAPVANSQSAVALNFQIGRLRVGNFVAELLNFIIIAFAVFLMIVKFMGSVMKRVGGAKPSEATTKECPECLSIIPIKAKRCAHCTTVLPDPP